MATWLDHHDPGQLAAAISNVASLRPDDWAANLARADGDERYALWLTLATDRLSEFQPLGVPKPTEATWRAEYIAGASPRSAAFAAWTGAAADPEIIPLLTGPLEGARSNKGWRP
jgi:hypothetical protein